MSGKTFKLGLNRIAYYVRKLELLLFDEKSSECLYGMGTLFISDDIRDVS